MLSLAHVTPGHNKMFLNTKPHLVPEVLDGHVLAVDVQGVVLGHGQHLLQVGLHGRAVLMVDGVAIT